MGKVSVIVPMYNAGRYLGACLQALLRQTYTDLEILLIDDGSNDNTVDVARPFCVADARVRLLCQQNHGVSHARNAGIEQSQGAYLAFVDADDVVAPDFVRVMVEAMAREHAQCAVVGIHSFSEESEIHFGTGADCVRYTENLRELLLASFGGYMANKLYAADLIRQHGLRLDETVAISEDMLFNLAYFSLCDAVCWLPGDRYFYRQHGASAYNALDNAKWFSVLDAYPKMLALCDDAPGARDRLRYQYLMTLYEARYRAKKSFAHQHGLVRSIDAQIRAHAAFAAQLDIKQRVKLLLFQASPGAVMRYRRRMLRGGQA